MEIRQQFNTLPILADMQQNLCVIQEYHQKRKKSVPLKVNEWATPIGLLPLAIQAKRCDIEITFGKNKQSVQGYLRSIRFPNGVSTLNTLRRGSYLPITRLGVSTGDQTLTTYENMILGKVQNDNLRSSFTDALKYLTSEVVTNVREHARIEDYWIAAQYWGKTETCEIAIADTGIGYRESYKGTRFECESHSDAISNAIDGKSSKVDVERGAGIPGMVNLFCKGYGGELAIMSGDALLYLNRNTHDFYELEYSWDGVFIGLRFNLSDIHALSFLS